ncbi:MAG: hypothetical protein WC821_00045 [archaeon]|jgi:hypothetical protein
MVICFIALGVFAILGIFSAKYRAYFFEAADCVFKKTTLRKCTTSFDKKMKVKITSKVSIVNKSLGAFIFKKFEAISMILVLIMLVTLVWSAYISGIAVYNWVAFGNCNGPNISESCVLNTITGKIEPAPIQTTDHNINCDLNEPKDANLFASNWLIPEAIN